MLIAALNKLTLLDYPGKTAAIIFTAGCNMRCGYCHNAQFVLPEEIQKQKKDLMPWEEVRSFLKKRKGLLDGVVISGGEPTLQKDLKEKIKEIKSMGFLVKLDTNGTGPQIIKELLQENFLDFIAMDIKGSEAVYHQICGKKIDIKAIEKSIEIIMNSGIDYEFRSTILPEYHSKDVLCEMGRMIQGSKTWAL
ncbi:anaerobic ribonucleoside-triphosphate reductase activating protein, partial [Candidatus Peregrinibacteria bacterium]|nr:anaerobic ribonucleoside-triphosphate reductase activating protein [Candidatus Peregrinibacteria bacterium]